MRYYRIIYIAALVIFLIPLAEQQLGLVDKMHLNGYFQVAPKPVLTRESYLETAYQEQAEKYANENFGLRTQLLGLRNQAYYNVLCQSPNADFCIGKNGYLFETRYLEEYYGNNFIGDTTLDFLTNDIKKLQDTLANHHILLLTVIAPSKPYYFPEYVPEQFDLTPGDDRTNYSSFVRMAKGKSIHLLDFNKAFQQLKSKTRFPLYTKAGTHWSYFGATLSFDAMLRKMSALSGKQFPKMQYTGSESEGTDGNDYDLIRTLNLLHVPPEQGLAVPRVSFEPVNGYVPRVLGVTDSYYGVLDELGLPEHCFQSPDYWFSYYMKLPHEKYDSIQGKENFLYNEIMSHDVIILMCTPPNLHKLGWGFTADALKLFDKTNAKPYQYDYVKLIRIEDLRYYILHNPPWLHAILSGAKDQEADPDRAFEDNVKAQVK
jgi:hypothetical protein